MGLHLGHRGGPRKLPKPVHDYMRQRFGALPEYLETLQCFEFEGAVNGKKARRFRIYSPGSARQKKVRIAQLSDLEKNPELLLYEAYIDEEGKAYVADRRSPLRIGRKQKTPATGDSGQNMHC